VAALVSIEPGAGQEFLPAAGSVPVVISFGGAMLKAVAKDWLSLVSLSSSSVLSSLEALPVASSMDATWKDFIVFSLFV
jgi:hypothetical protein